MNKKNSYFVTIHVIILDITLANQIQQYIQRIIHHGKEGDMPRMQGWFNIQQSVNVIHHINTTKGGNT